MIIIKYLEMNQILALSKPQRVDMPLNEPSQTKPNRSSVWATDFWL